jgi:hypothetical protein
MTSVTGADGCCGFILKRGPRGFDAFNADCRSLGLFNTEQEAVDAILKAPQILSANADESLAREGEDV